MNCSSILLADPKDLQGKMLKFRLENEGFKVFHCRTPKDIKSSLNQNTPDLIIFAGLPDFTFADLHNLLTLKIKSEVPTLIITSNTNSLPQKTEVQKNIISAPVSPSELVTRVHQLLGKEA